MTIIDDPNEGQTWTTVWTVEHPIVKDEGINALRELRAVIDSTLTTASSELVRYRHTVMAQNVRIEELEAENKLLSETEDNLHTVLEDEYRDKATVQAKLDQVLEATGVSLDELGVSLDELEDSYTAAPNLARKMKQGQMERMENVCRLANAALVHLDSQPEHPPNAGAARALIEPLAQGVHDVYEYHGDTDVISEPRPRDASQADLFDEAFGPIAKGKTSIVRECFAEWIADCNGRSE